ncbi:MAG: response regulator [Bacteroidales bacterium]|nr:response regulator [Bacteroidales bacterium]
MDQQSLDFRVCLLMINGDLNVEGMNDAASETFNGPPEELHEIHCHKLLHGSDMPCDFCKIQSLKSGKENDFTYSFAKEGLIFDCRLSRMTGPVDKPKYIYLIERRSGSPEGSDMQKDRERELIRSRQKAEEADRLKTAFLTNMSHEIRTPMNAIIGFSELLSNPEITQEEISSYTRIIKSRCNHLLQIVNDILDISKIEANQIELKEIHVNLNHLFDDLYMYYAQKVIDEKKFRINLNVEKPQENAGNVIMVDELRLRQIIGNLLDNAVKFTREGKIEFGYRFIEDRVLIYVSDTGIGIAEEKHGNIFERFSQIDTSLVRQFGGNGLGLAICKAFVELMGGKIWLESKVGEGSTFLFTLPRKNGQQDQPEEEKPQEIRNFNWKGKKILLVEDDRSSARFMHELLKLTHVEMAFAYTASEALEIFTGDQHFHLVLMDIQLPDRNGLDLARLFKGYNRTVPIIAQTAYAMEGDNIKCIQAGCDDYISKPLNISDLFLKLDRFLST